jgi:penicillin-binding protein 2
VILEPVRKKLSAEDDSFVGIRVGALLIIVFVLFGVLTFRLWFLQILSGDSYVAVAKDNRLRDVRVEAPRGVVYDRNGKIMVENRAGLSVGILPMDMYDPKKDPDKFQQELAGLAQILDINETDLQAAYDRAKKNPYVTYVVKEDVPENTVVAQIKEHNLEYQGVQVEASYLRQYPFGALATHLLGYVGEVSQNDLDSEEFATLRPGASVGKDGIERKYDSFLRGTDGWRTVEVDAAGRPKQFLESRAPTPGSNLVLTIDTELQKAAEDAIVEGIRRAQEEGFPNAAGGAVVALDPRNGEVLAMASYPDYDPSLWVGGMTRTKYAELTAPQAHYPLFDRVIDGLYPAGSTFKPFVAAAALNAGLITADTTFNCTGTYSTNQQTWKDWKATGHGEVNLLQAITESCDVYFYNLGSLLYQQPSPVLQDGVRQFGFGQPTGIDLPGETTNSRVPDKYWKSETGKTKEDQVWRIGDEINLAIGQGDLLATPLQMAVGLSAIANGGSSASGTGLSPSGTLWVPHLGLRITDASGNIVHQFDSEKRGELGMSPDILDLIRTGMVQVTSDPSGTAYAAFKGFPITVAGKTGTAEKKPEDDYALFMAFAPADVNAVPEIAVVAIIEQGGHGSSIAAPVVRRVLEAYFHTESGGAKIIPVTE